MRNVWKSYGGDYVLRGASLRVRSGQRVIIVGPNGSGKTTLIKISCGLVPPSRGEVFINGINVRSPRARALIGYVAHRPLLYEDLSVRDNLLYYAGLYGYKDLGHVERLLDSLDLRGYMDRKVSSLSHGWKRRVDLARALLHNPLLLLMDEPLSGVDADGRRALMDVLIRSDCSVVMTSPVEVRMKGAEIVEIREGRLFASSDREDHMEGP